MNGLARLERYLAMYHQTAMMACIGLITIKQNQVMKRIAFLFVAPVLTHFASAQQNPVVRQKQVNLEKGLAIRGYDPVACFAQSKAVKGSAANTTTLKGVTYCFASAASQALFQANPATYEP